eukprot:3228451-Rhodomonas_salina.1
MGRSDDKRIPGLHTSALGHVRYCRWGEKYEIEWADGTEDDCVKRPDEIRAFECWECKYGEYSQGQNSMVWCRAKLSHDEADWPLDPRSPRAERCARRRKGERAVARGGVMGEEGRRKRARDEEAQEERREEGGELSLIHI